MACFGLIALPQHAHLVMEKYPSICPEGVRKFNHFAHLRNRHLAGLQPYHNETAINAGYCTLFAQ